MAAATRDVRLSVGWRPKLAGEGAGCDGGSLRREFIWQSDGGRVKVAGTARNAGPVRDVHAWEWLIS